MKRLLIITLFLLPVLAFTSGCGPVAAQTGDTVEVNYTGKLTDGTVFDSTSGGEPYEFTLGQGQVIPGFEQAVTGMKIGESKTVSIPADEAYGPRRDDLIVEVNRDELPPDIDPQVGMQLQTDHAGGILVVTITGVSETTVTVDANHPLAGQDLTFDIELVGLGASQGGTASSGLASMSLQQALASGRPTLAEFSSDTCLPCKQMKPILETLAAEQEGRLNVVLVDVYEQPELSQEYNILAVPTQIFFDGGGEEVSRHVGFWSREQIDARLNEIGIE
jgi:peptidylprolyl isomerase